MGLANKMLTFACIEAGEETTEDVTLVVEVVWDVSVQTVLPRVTLIFRLRKELLPVLGNSQQLEQWS